MGSQTSEEPPNESTLFSLCLDEISKNPASGLSTFAKFASKPESPLFMSFAIRQQILFAIIRSGRVQDDTIPDGFFTQDFTAISLCSENISGLRISQSTLFQISKNCPHLCELNIGGCLYVTDDMISTVISSCPSMHSLTLTGCRKLTDLTCSLLLQLQDLKRIELGGCVNITTEGIKALLSHTNASNFTLIDLSGCEIDDSIVDMIKTRCQLLKSLGLGFSGASAECITSTLQTLNRIKILKLHWCTRLRKGEFTDLLCNNSYLSNLQYLDITAANWMDDDLLSDILAVRFQNPLTIKMKFCKISTEYIDALNSHYPNITIEY